MVVYKIRFALACVLGMIPFVFNLVLYCYMARIYKFIKKYKSLDWLDRRLAHLLSLHMEVWCSMLDIRVYVLGAEHSKWVHEPSLVMSNHSNTFDSLLNEMRAYLYFQRVSFYHGHDRTPVNWITNLFTAKEQYFAKGDGTDALNFEQHLKKHFFPMYKHSVIYPEGGLTKKMAKKSEEYGIANNIPLFKHVAMPHIKAVKAVLNALAPTEEEASLNQENQQQRLKWVADQTILYSDDNISVSNLFQGVKKTTSIYFYTKLYEINEIPRDAAHLTKWIHERFREKDMILENFKIHGKLPTDDPCTRTVIFTTDFVIFYTLYLLSMYSFIVCPLSSLIIKYFT